jgi:hypothetical protein
MNGLLVAVLMEQINPAVQMWALVCRAFDSASMENGALAMIPDQVMKAVMGPIMIVTVGLMKAFSMPVEVAEPYLLKLVT